jgi:hypothetical protein
MQISQRYGQVAQSVEQGTENPRVDGSIPPLATIQIKYLHHFIKCATFLCKHYVSTLVYSTPFLFAISAPTIIQHPGARPGLSSIK